MLLNATQFEMIGRSNVMSGLQAAIEILQRELDQLRGLVTEAIDAAETKPKRGRPPKVEVMGGPPPQARKYVSRQNAQYKSNQAKGVADYWARMTPEQREAELEKRRQTRRANAAKKQTKAKRAAAKKTASVTLVKEKAALSAALAREKERERDALLKARISVSKFGERIGEDYTKYGAIKALGLNSEAPFLKRMQKLGIKTRNVPKPDGHQGMLAVISPEQLQTLLAAERGHVNGAAA